MVYLIYRYEWKYGGFFKVKCFNSLFVVNVWSISRSKAIQCLLEKNFMYGKRRMCFNDGHIPFDPLNHVWSFEMVLFIQLLNFFDIFLCFEAFQIYLFNHKQRLGNLMICTIPNLFPTMSNKGNNKLCYHFGLYFWYCGKIDLWCL